MIPHKRERVLSRIFICRAAPLLASLVFLLPCPATAYDRLNLPQSNEKIVLEGPAREALETALAAAPGGTPSFALASEPAAQLIGSLPEDFRDSCSDVVGTLGEGARETARWTVRVLFSSATAGGTEAVLALRCGSAAPNVEAYYDERPAIVALGPQSATLALIPLAKDCINCSDLYHLEFSQTFTAVGARLLELRVSYANESPCCDGGDQQSGEQRLILRLPEGEQVLTVDQGTASYSHDDEDGDSDLVCEAKIDYSRVPAGNVESIRSETRCTVNKEPIPDVKTRSFRWNAAARRFDELKTSPR
ncbi:MAG TPA: hypothetical protein VEU31_05580 [Candidatus Acidoferrales bacterium]|nr:hypothetical protein [Candidatus Acidoferrales bacterium]